MVWLNIQEAASYLGYKVRTLYDKVSKKEIPYYKVGRHVLFDEKELDAYIRQNRVGTAQELLHKAEHKIHI